MGKREDEQLERIQRWRDQQEKTAWENTGKFESAIAASESAYNIATYRALMNSVIMHFSRVSMTGQNYDNHYFIGDGFMKAAQLMLMSARLALAAHKIDLDHARFEQTSSRAVGRHKHQNRVSYEELPHAKDNEPSKHLAPGQKSTGDVAREALQSANQNGSSVP